MVKGIIIAVLVGIIGGDVALEIMFPMPANAEQACCRHWNPCPNRKKVRMNGHTYTWYCGPDSERAVDARVDTEGVDAGTAPGRDEKRVSKRRAGIEGHHAAH